MFSMHETSVRALDNCDAAFKRFLLKRIITEEDKAKEELESCERFAGETIHVVTHWMEWSTARNSSLIAVP